MTRTFAQALVLACIRFYQRHLSPQKGFACAYRVHTGRGSCSTLGYRAVRRRGVRWGTGVLRLRLARCGDVHRQHHPQPGPMRLHAQRGSCDLPCDIPCDGSDALKFGDFCNCCDCGDWSRRRDKRRERR